MSLSRSDLDRYYSKYVSHFKKKCWISSDQISYFHWAEERGNPETFSVQSVLASTIQLSVWQPAFNRIYALWMFSDPAREFCILHTPYRLTDRTPWTNEWKIIPFDPLSFCLCLLVELDYLSCLNIPLFLAFLIIAFWQPPARQNSHSKQHFKY